jgi:UDP-N-acetylmuramate dehydrogenase
LNLTISRHVPLSPFTTLQLGGPAEYFVHAADRPTLIEVLRWARASSHAVSVLGGGSNLVVADRGVSGLVVHMATRGLEIVRFDDHALVTAQAGESFQGLVDCVLAENFSGLECLTGIPGLVGATPIQNVGAYGQEVSDTIEAVEVLDRADFSTRWLAAKDCGFGYRNSQFKRVPERYVVLAVRYRLAIDGAPKLAYPELVRALDVRHARPSLREVADVVWALRAGKSMVLNPADDNGRSAGSFFTNPIVSSAEAAHVCCHAVAAGMANSVEEVPCYDAGAGAKKLAAGWLIERAGVHKGLRMGAVGVSSRHALSLVHHGGGSTAELLALAAEIQQRVQRVFGIELQIEPVRWG